MKWIKTIEIKIRDTKFAYKMFAAFFLTSSITLIPLGIYSYYQAHANLFYQEKKSVEEQIWQDNFMLEGQIARYQTVISSLISNKQIQQCLNTKDISYFQQYLMYTNTLEPTIENIVGAHADVFPVKIYTDNEMLKGHSKYLYALEEMPSYGRGDAKGMLAYQIDENKMTAIARYIPAGNGMTHILYMQFDISKIMSLMMEDNREVIFVDGNGETIFASRGMGEEGDYSGMETGQEIRMNGEEYLLFANEIKETEWKSLCFVPKGKLDVNDPSILEATGLYIILAAVLCFAVSGLLCRWLLKPLQNLQENICEVENGNFELEVSSEAADEIGQLTNAFGMMIRKLNVLVNEVYRSQITQKEAEFKMLQAQLNPHFLYNTLSFINWSALRAGEKGIAKISRDISSFYRTALNSGTALTTVEGELLNARSYVNIQLALHNNSFDVEYEIDEKCLSCKIICNILQPLIENALEHGIDKKKNGRGKLEIQIGMNEGELVLTVADNGPGFDGSMEKVLVSKESKGYGLKNVNDRIRIFYGEVYGIRAGENQAGNTRIHIRVPVL